MKALRDEIAKDIFNLINYPAKFERALKEEQGEFLEAADDAIKTVLDHYACAENITERMMKAAHHAFTHNYNENDPFADWRCAFMAALKDAREDVSLPNPSRKITG